jgi:thioredoxin-like negative regulator of GroEL
MKIIEINGSNPTFNKWGVDNTLNKGVFLIGVFSKSCGHCIDMKPEWEKLKNNLKTINSNDCLLEVDSDNLESINNDKLVSSIRGYPSIVLFKDGRLVSEYNGNRVADDMFNFVKPHINEKNDEKPKKMKKAKRGKRAKKGGKRTRNRKSVRGKRTRRM